MGGDAQATHDPATLISLAYDSPSETVELATRLLSDDVPNRDGAHVYRALGVALRILGDAVQAEAALVKGLDCARMAEDAQLEALVEMTLAVTLLYRGRSNESLALFEAAQARSTGAVHALVMSERGGALLRLGRTDDGLALLDEALPTLLAASDATDAADLLTNRGIARSFLGRYDDAEEDLLEAQRRYLSAGARMHAARMTWNLAFVAARRGEIARGLALFDRAERELTAAGGAAAELAADRCSALLMAGLTAEAAAFASIAVEDCRRGGRDADLAEALLLLARCALADSASVDAHRAAAEAIELFEQQGRVPWAVQAAVLLARARIESDDVDEPLVEGLARHAATLRQHDRHAADTAAILRLLALAKLGRHQEVQSEAQMLGRGLPIELDVARTRALAFSTRQQGDLVGALTIIDAGLAALDRHRSVLASTELRTHIAAHVIGLVDLAVDIALAVGTSDALLMAAEAQRAHSLRFQRVAPPRDPVLARLLSRLRQSLDERADADDPDTKRAHDQERDQLERSIQNRARSEQGPLRHLHATATMVEVRAALRSDEVLVEMVNHGGDVFAVVVSDDRMSLEHVAHRSDLDRYLAVLPTLYWRVASRTGDARLISQAEVQMATIVERLDDVLRPLVAGAARIALSPTAAFHAAPWRLLPSLRQAPVVTVPSASTFVSLRSRPHRRRETVLPLAGPGLAHAAHEVREVARLYPQTSHTDGSVEGVLAALAASDVAHFACHGRFRHGNPLLSSLVLAGGPMTVYDLERCEVPPEVVVLSACHLGMSTAYAGDELAGLTHALLGLGVRSVIASVTPTPDTPATVELMVALHRHLAAGIDPADALFRASTEVGPDGALVAAAFAVFGA